MERNGTLYTHWPYNRICFQVFLFEIGFYPEWKEFFKAALPLSAGSKMYVCVTNGFCPGSEVARECSKSARNSAFSGRDFYIK